MFLYQKLEKSKTTGGYLKREAKLRSKYSPEPVPVGTLL
jgi:hypothetical protein